MKCLHPIFVNGMWCPCGKCPQCRSAIRGDMSTRIWLETQMSGSRAFFITLTYDDDHLRCNKLGLPCFSKKDCQNFLKDLRRYGEIPIRFFLTCEYGEQTFRAHYHLIVWSKEKRSLQWWRELVDRCWRKGRTQVKTCNIERIQYATSYALKDEDQYLIDWSDIPDSKPFRLFSMRPGIGGAVLDSVGDYIFNDGVNYRSSVDLAGNIMRIPKYFIERMDFADDLKQHRYLKHMEMQDELRQLHDAHMKEIRPHGCASFKVADYSVDEEILKTRKKLRKLRKEKYSDL